MKERKEGKWGKEQKGSANVITRAREKERKGRKA